MKLEPISPPHFLPPVPSFPFYRASAHQRNPATYLGTSNLAYHLPITVAPFPSWMIIESFNQKEVHLTPSAFWTRAHFHALFHLSFSSHHHSPPLSMVVISISDSSILPLLSPYYFNNSIFHTTNPPGNSFPSTRIGIPSPSGINLAHFVISNHPNADHIHHYSLTYSARNTHILNQPPPSSLSLSNL